MVTLVTGGTGYLGGRLVAALVARGETVRVLLRPGTSVPRSMPTMQVAVGDVSVPEDAVAAMDGVRFVYHLAGIHDPNCVESDPVLTAVNVSGTRHVLQAARVTGVERVAHVLSTFALGPTDQGIRDESPPKSGLDAGADEDTFGPWFRSIREADAIARSFEGLDVIRIYSGQLYGPGENHAPNGLTARIDALARQRRPWALWPSDRRWTTAYIDDVIRGCPLAMENGQPGEAYILGGEEIDGHGLADLVGELLGQEVRPRFVPRFIRTLLAFMGRSSGGSRMRRVQLALDDRDWRFTSQKAIAELGYSRTPIKIGLRRTLEFLGHLSEDRDVVGGAARL